MQGEFKTKRINKTRWNPLRAFSKRRESGKPSCKNPGRRFLRRLRSEEGAEVFEFAMALPLLLVLVVGIIDFARAYNTKHVTVNAARLAARTMASTPLTIYDPNCTWNKSSPGTGTPCPIKGVAITVGNYLANAGLTAGSCLETASATYSSPMTWTFSCSSVTLIINKAYNVSSAVGVIPSTKVTLSYPYTFMFGRIIGLLVPGATGPIGQIILTTNSVMRSLVQS